MLVVCTKRLTNRPPHLYEHNNLKNLNFKDCLLFLPFLSAKKYFCALTQTFL